MIRNSKLVTMMTVVLSLDSVSYALAQSAISAPAQKTIGSAKAEMVPSLIVMNAKSATIQGQTSHFAVFNDVSELGARTFNLGRIC